MTELSIIYVNRKEIIPYAKNPRIHDEKHINQIVSSIKTFDFTNPILLDENNEILAGHGRFLAAQHLQIESLPCVILPHLTKAQKKDYLHLTFIQDNSMAIYLHNTLACLFIVVMLINILYSMLYITLKKHCTFLTRKHLCISYVFVR